jgi:hypothetical protein
MTPADTWAIALGWWGLLPVYLLAVREGMRR